MFRELETILYKLGNLYNSFCLSFFGLPYHTVYLAAMPL